MRRLIGVALGVGIVGLWLGLAEAAKCPPDAVQVGPTCVDRYEASVWKATDAGLIAKIRKGNVKLADLAAAGATQYGLAEGDLADNGCPRNGNGCTDFYAVSIAGVTPSRFITWLQAAAAARNAGKRLPTNAEWQAAALGTPDGAPCIVNAADPGPTGTPGCESDIGAFDMVGNLSEWVADWVPRSASCPGWGAFSDDLMCLAGADEAPVPPGPGALLRGGSFLTLVGGAGVFSVIGLNPPSVSINGSGFRAAQ